MNPTPTWAIYRDLKTGQLVRKYIASASSSTSKTQAAGPKACATS